MHSKRQAAKPAPPRLASTAGLCEASGHDPRSLDERVELLAGDWDDEFHVGPGGAD